MNIIAELEKSLTAELEAIEEMGLDKALEVRELDGTHVATIEAGTIEPAFIKKIEVLSEIPTGALWLLLSQKIMAEGVLLGLRNTMALHHEGEWHVSRDRFEPVIQVIDASADARKSAIHRRMEIAEGEIGRFKVSIQNRINDIERNKFDIESRQKKHDEMGVIFDDRDRAAIERLIKINEDEKESLMDGQARARKNLKEIEDELHDIPEQTSYWCHTEGPFVVHVGQPSNGPLSV